MSIETVLITLSIIALVIFIVFRENKFNRSCTGNCNQGRKPCDCRGK